MTNVDIKITSWYLEENNTLDNNVVNYEIEDMGGASRRFKDVREIAEDILFYITEFDIDPNYRINLWEGWHPLNKCEDNCNHKKYTQKPDEGVKRRT